MCIVIMYNIMHCQVVLSHDTSSVPRGNVHKRLYKLSFIYLTYFLSEIVLHQKVTILQNNSPLLCVAKGITMEMQFCFVLVKPINKNIVFICI